MDLSKLGNGEYSYSPESIGTYRVLNNIDKSKRPIKGCCLVYKLDGEGDNRYITVTDQQVREIPEASLQDADYINMLASNIYHFRYG